LWERDRKKSIPPLAALVLRLQARAEKTSSSTPAFAILCLVVAVAVNEEDVFKAAFFLMVHGPASVQRIFWL
jgi:hypothetical protein